MFCNKCGLQIPDGSAFCPSCGNKIEIAPVAAPAMEAPVAAPAMEAPVAAPVVEAPVAAPVVEAPVVEAPTQPVYTTPVAPVAPAAPEQAPKKKSKSLLIIIIAIVAALAVAAGALYFTGVFDDLFGTSQSDSDDEDDKDDKKDADSDEDDGDGEDSGDVNAAASADDAAADFVKLLAEGNMKAFGKLYAYDYEANLKDDLLNYYDSEEAFFEEMSDEYGEDITSWKKLYAAAFEASKENLADTYGSDYKITTKVTDSAKLSKSELTTLREDMLDYYGNYLDEDKVEEISTAYEITVKATIKGSEDEDVSSLVITVVDYDGKWKIVDYSSQEESDSDYPTIDPDYDDPSYDYPSYDDPSYDEPSYDEPSYDEPSYGYTVGYVSGGTYYNLWADLQFQIPSGWKDLTSNYQTGSIAEDFGLYVQDETNGIVVEIAFTKNDLSSREYMINFRDDLEMQMAAAGFTIEYSDLYESASVADHDGVGTIGVASTSGVDVYIGLFTYRVDDYAVLLNVSALTEDDMNEMMEEFSPCNSYSFSYGDEM